MHEDTEVIRRIASRIYDVIRNRKYGKAFADFTKIREAVELMADNDELVVFKAKGTNRLIGALSFTIDEPWYSSKPCFDETFVIQIDPSFLGFGEIACEFMKAYAKSRGCACMSTAVSMTDKPAALLNTYMRKGKCTFAYPNCIWVFPSN